MDEERLFDGILKRQEFDSLSKTSEKIRLCLEKDVFNIRYRGMVYNPNNVFPANFHELDLSIFNKDLFDISEFYSSNDYSISLNDILYTEIVDVFDSQIGLLNTQNEIEFNLSTLLNKKAKIKYLQSVISEINPFELKNLYVEYNPKRQPFRLAINPWWGYDFIFIAKEYFMDYLFGEVYSGGAFEFNRYKKITDLANDYIKLQTARSCYYLIEKYKIAKPKKEKTDFKTESTFKQKKTYSCFRDKNAETILHNCLEEYDCLLSPREVKRKGVQPYLDAFFTVCKKNTRIFKRNTKLRIFIEYLNEEYSAGLKNFDKLSDGQIHIKGIRGLVHEQLEGLK